MTPYTKKIVELHKIHKAIENRGYNKENDGGGGSSISDIFFKLASIQPNRYIVVPSDDDVPTLIDIENLYLNTYIDYCQNDKGVEFFYSKEEIAKLGVSLEELEALDYSLVIEVDNSIIRDNFIINSLSPVFNDTVLTSIQVNNINYNPDANYGIMRVPYGDNNNYVIREVIPFGG